VRKGFPLLLCLVGDSLSNQPWQDGAGTARGILSCLDCSWTIRSWSLHANPLQVISEREQLKEVVTNLSEKDLKLKYKKYSLDPRSRFSNLLDLKPSLKNNIIRLYDTDNKEEMRYLSEKFLARSFFDNLSYDNIIYRYKATGSRPGKEGSKKIRQALRKKSLRIKENIYLRLGKTGKSNDKELQEQIRPFKKQYAEVQRLTKSVCNYVTALEGIRSAESELLQAWASNIQDWNNLENFLHNSETIQERRTENIANLTKDVVLPLKTYKQQFQDVMGRLSRCEHLRIEADIRQHQLKKALSKNQQNVSAEEVSKSESFADYSNAVEELKDELPSLYGIRQEFFAQSLYSLFVQQNNFNTELSYIYREMTEYVLIKLRAN